MTGTPDALRQARALDTQAENLETVLERVARRQNQPELVNQLREARTYIAKTYDVERALNIGNGNVDAQIIGRALDRGRPLTGNLEIIGRFAQGPGRQFTREASKVPAAGVSALKWPAALALGMEGAHFFGPYGAAAGAVPLASSAIRSGILSDTYQNNFNRPNYAPALQPQAPIPALLQQGILSNR